MSYKYPTAVVGCLAHAAALTGILYILLRPGPNGTGNISHFFFAFVCAWPLWAIALWICAPGHKFLGTSLPLLIGAYLLWPVLVLIAITFLFGGGHHL